MRSQSPCDKYAVYRWGKGRCFQSQMRSQSPCDDARSFESRRNLYLLIADAKPLPFVLFVLLQLLDSWLYFNLRCEANPLATEPVNLSPWLIPFVSIADAKPILWRPRHAVQGLVPRWEFQSQMRSQSSGD